MSNMSLAANVPYNNDRYASYGSAPADTRSSDPSAKGGREYPGSPQAVDAGGKPVNPDQAVNAAGDKSSGKCQTCENRKYQDASDENVSFKSPSRVAPQAAGAAVRSHEQEHVSNAYSKAAKDNGKVLSASVSIKTAVCPECGRSYVSGGETRTQIKYYNEENPYQQDLKNSDYYKYGGMNADYAV